MKTYKDFEKKYIGESDGACLRMVGGENPNSCNVIVKKIYALAKMAHIKRISLMSRL